MSIFIMIITALILAIHPASGSEKSLSERCSEEVMHEVNQLDKTRLEIFKHSENAEWDKLRCAKARHVELSGEFIAKHHPLECKYAGIRTPSPWSTHRTVRTKLYIDVRNTDLFTLGYFLSSPALEIYALCGIYIDDLESINE